MPEISVEKLTADEWLTFAPTWERIHAACAGASMFLSREWVACWLATFGGTRHVDLLVFLGGGEAVGCCLLVRRTERIRGVPLRRIFLNCAGEDEADSTCIEYNSLLCLPGWEEGVARAFVVFLRRIRWDELHLPGVEEGQPVNAVAGSFQAVLEVTTKPSHYVDLERVRGAVGGFDSTLSSNTRQQIRRSQRLYEEASGVCTLRVAKSVEEALEALDLLAGLHQEAWMDRGRPGVFASARFTGFHRELIRSAFGQNRILLSEARAGGELIGSLYSFLYRGRVYFYQSGFRYAKEPRLKPGLLTHYLAVQHCVQQPAFLEYDFLAGDSQYKRSLATSSRPMQWSVIRRATVPTLIYRSLRFVKRSYARIH
jgi:CelD/BcsL family acetyltransferase involved in cellulose biosynthesis